jgi:hypothetical protein
MLGRDDQDDSFVYPVQWSFSSPFESHSQVMVYVPAHLVLNESVTDNVDVVQTLYPTPHDSEFGHGIYTFNTCSVGQRLIMLGEATHELVSACGTQSG